MAPFAYVTNNGSGSVSVIDTATNAVVATPSVDGAPLRIAVTPDGTRAYVTNHGSSNVSVIDTANNTVSATVDVGVDCIEPDGQTPPDTVCGNRRDLLRFARSMEDDYVRGSPAA